MRTDNPARPARERNITATLRPPIVSYEAALLACAAGCQTAIARIYADEGAQLRAAAQRIVGSRDRAEDVVHDAFAQILRDARNFDPTRGSARAWIYTIVRHVALKSLYVAEREYAVGEDCLRSMLDQQQALQDPGSSPAESAALRSCLEQLDPRRRASLILAIVDGRTHAEVAEYLGVPIGTVKTWIRRELIALREQLK